MDRCPICGIDYAELEPVQGCDLPPRPGVERWSMSPREWAGEPPRRDAD